MSHTAGPTCLEIPFGQKHNFGSWTFCQILILLPLTVVSRAAFGGFPVFA